MEFTFTINVPILLAIGGIAVGLFRYFRVIVLALNKVTELSTAFKDMSDKVDQHDRDISALQALSIGYGRGQARQRMRERD